MGAFGYRSQLQLAEEAAALAKQRCGSCRIENEKEPRAAARDGGVSAERRGVVSWRGRRRRTRAEAEAVMAAPRCS